MPYPRRDIAGDQGIYHVITRGNNGQRLFTKVQDFEYFLQILSQIRQIGLLKIYHFCLMSNHIHLLMDIDRINALSAFMKRLLLKYTYYHKREYNFQGQLYQGRFKTLAIEDDAYLLECGRYIERNPVNAGLVQNPMDYPYSSYSVYAAGTHLPFVIEDPLYAQLGQSSRERQQHYRTYVCTERPYERLIHQQILQLFKKRRRARRVSNWRTSPLKEEPVQLENVS